MANWTMQAGWSAGISPDATNWFPPYGFAYPYGVEAGMQFIAREDITLSNLFARVTINTLGQAFVVKVRKNGGDGNQSVTIPSATTGTFEDTVNTDDLVDGDLFCYQYVSPAGTGSARLNIVSVVATKQMVGGFGWGQNLDSNLTRYMIIGGCTSYSSTEVDCQYIFRVASTLSNMRPWAYANDLDGASTVRTRVDGGNGSQSVSIPAATAGAFEDITNTDNIVSGNAVNYQVVTSGSSGDLRLRSIGMRMLSSGFQLIASDALPNYLIAQDLTGYLHITGIVYFKSTESDVQSKTRFAHIIKNLFVRVKANDLTGSTTVGSRKNGVTGLSVSIDGAATGAFEDTSTTVTLDNDDLVNYIVTTGTGGNGDEITFMIFGVEQRQGAAVVGPFPTFFRP